MNEQQLLTIHVALLGPKPLLEVWKLSLDGVTIVIAHDRIGPFLHEVRATCPHIVIVAQQLRDFRQVGYEVATDLSDLRPQTLVIIISHEPLDGNQIEAYKKGAEDFVTLEESERPGFLLACVQEAVARQAQHYVTPLPRTTPTSHTQRRLTQVERDALNALRLGGSHKSALAHLNKSHGTIKRQLDKIFDKLDLVTPQRRWQNAVEVAVRLGEIEPLNNAPDGPQVRPVDPDRDPPNDPPRPWINPKTIPDT